MDLENIYKIEEELQNKKALVYDELFFQSLTEFPLRKKIATYLKKQKIDKSAKIIDIGCGTGELLKFLESEGYYALYGNDISEEMLKIAQKKLKNCIFYHGNINKVEIDKKFNFIIITEALHHIPDLRKTFKSLESLLADEGRILLLEPNKDWFFEHLSHKNFFQYLIYLPLAPLRKFVSIKNKEIIQKNSKYDTPDTFNPFHRHLTLKEILSSTEMNITQKRFFSFYLGLFEGRLFKGNLIDKAIYLFISMVDLIIPFYNKGKYFLLVLKK